MYFHVLNDERASYQGKAETITEDPVLLLVIIKKIIYTSQSPMKGIF